jgi:hypothetical protein
MTAKVWFRLPQGGPYYAQNVIIIAHKSIVKKIENSIIIVA